MDVSEMYQVEKERLAKAMMALENFEFTNFNETERKIFEMAAHNELGKAGFTCTVNWEEYCNAKGEGLGVWAPVIGDVDRNKKEAETDHDRIRHEIVTGQVDGIKGYVREDGTWNEDPIKGKIIT